MYIRLAKQTEIKSVMMSIRNKHIDYNTPLQAKEDILNNRLYVMIDNEKIIASCAIVPETQYNYLAIKRLVIFRKENQRKGIADNFIKYFIKNFPDNLGATPFSENKAMINLLTKNNFVYKYNFLEKYCFYLREFL